MKNQMIRPSTKSRTKTRTKTGRLNFRQQLQNLGVMIVLVLSFNLSAEDQIQNKPQRNPASYVQTEMDPRPIGVDEETFFVEDDAGVMQTMREDVSSWEYYENYVANWNMESTGLYSLPTEKDKRSYFSKMALRYLDKRLSGEMRKADQSTAIRQVANIHKSMQPTGSVEVASNIKLKVKARPLQGKVYFIIENPYIDYQTKVSADGKIVMMASKKIESVGIHTGVNYNVRKSVWEITIDKTITENIIARASNTSDQNRTMQLIFTKSF